MNIRKILTISGATLSLVALLSPVQYMGESIYSFNILLIGLSAFIPREPFDVAIAFAVLATLQAVVAAAAFVRGPLAVVAFLVALVGACCAVLVAFRGGPPTSIATFFWLSGLLASLAGLWPNTSVNPDALKRAGYFNRYVDL